MSFTWGYKWLVLDVMLDAFCNRLQRTLHFRDRVKLVSHHRYLVQIDLYLGQIQSYLGLIQA